MKTIPLYSKVFCTDSLDIDDEYFNQIKQAVKNCDYKQTGFKDNRSSLVNQDYAILDKPQFKLLGDMILKLFTKFTREHLKITNDFKISSSWFTKTEPNHESHYHRHYNCYYSGVLYIDTDSGGEIIFDNMADERFLLNKIKDNEYNTRSFIFETENKMIIFFPSDIHHKIAENKTNKDRYSVAFNFYPIGNIGVGDSNVKLT
jgi:uncharacterized protein (TIGR02466 family)|tara:strand:+ start:2409 stop:3017 length:609 start_codon:yes stop_codon:yes gene_type:complete